MTVLHKLLVSKETGKIIFPVYDVNDPRPTPLDAEWVLLEPGSALYNHFSMDPPGDAAHISFDETYWDFDLGEWVEVASNSAPSFAQVKKTRNELLKQSDIYIVEATTEEEVNAWKLYRQQLRNMFVGTPPDFNWAEVIFPRNPVDIQTLHDLAAAGDENAAEIIKRDKL